MKHHTRLALTGLLSAVALTVAACGGVGGSANHGGTDDGSSEVEGGVKKTSMKGMERSEMASGSGGMAFRMLIEDGRYSDERFIGAMVPHHRGAVEMAEVALENAEHQEIRRLAENVVSTQEAEIAELEEIKEKEFGTSRVPMEKGSGQMEGMGIMAEPRALADEEPFDRAFIGAMIPHHRSAIRMANVALDRSDDPRIREISEEIVGAQGREISQMRAWRDDWYPEG